MLAGESSGRVHSFESGRLYMLAGCRFRWGVIEWGVVRPPCFSCGVWKQMCSPRGVQECARVSWPRLSWSCPVTVWCVFGFEEEKKTLGVMIAWNTLLKGNARTHWPRMKAQTFDFTPVEWLYIFLGGFEKPIWRSLRGALWFWSPRWVRWLRSQTKTTGAMLEGQREEGNNAQCQISFFKTTTFRTQLGSQVDHRGKIWNVHITQYSLKRHRLVRTSTRYRAAFRC